MRIIDYIMNHNVSEHKAKAWLINHREDGVTLLYSYAYLMQKYYHPNNDEDPINQSSCSPARVLQNDAEILDDTINQINTTINEIESDYVDCTQRTRNFINALTGYLQTWESNLQALKQ